MPDPVKSGGDAPWLRSELVASWGEIAGALLVWLAPSVVMSAWAATRGSQHHYVRMFLSDSRLLLNGLTEAGILGLALIYLHWRGWKPADLRIRPGIWSSLQAIALVPLALFANGLVVFGLLRFLFLHQDHYHNFGGYLLANSLHLKNLHAEQLSWVVLIGAMVLNAFLEEIICTAYAFNEFAAKRGPLFALLLIVPLRMACHTYQGWVHAVGIGAVFMVFTLWYWRTRNVWTLIFAHALLDLGSLSAVKVLAH